MMDNFPAIETERLLLRELIQEDAQMIFAIHSDAEAVRWYGSDLMKELTQAERLISAFAELRKVPNSGTRWGIERLEDGKLIGTCGLFRWNRKWRVSTIGYELSKEAQGQGFMSEALTAVLNWGMHEMELNRVEAQIFSQNAPSIKLAEHLGFCFEGTLRQLGYWEGRFHDLGGYSLLRSDWLTDSKDDE